MMSSLSLVPNLLKFLFGFRSIQLLSFISLLVTIIAYGGTTKTSGIGFNSEINIMGFEIYFALLTILFDTVFLLLTLFIILITVKISEFLFFGHFAQSLICKYRNRLPILAAYLVATLPIAFFAALLYNSHFIPVSQSLIHYLYALLYSILYFYTLILATNLVVNYSSLRKYTILIMIFLFYLTPMTLRLVIPTMTGSGFVNSSLRALLSGIDKLTSVHMEVNMQAENIIKTSLLQSGLILETVGLLSIYVLIIGYQYMRKDFS